MDPLFVFVVNDHRGFLPGPQDFFLNYMHKTELTASEECQKLLFLERKMFQTEAVIG